MIAKPSHCDQTEPDVVGVDAGEDEDSGVRELRDRRENGGRALQAVVVERKGEQPGHEGKGQDPAGRMHAGIPLRVQRDDGNRRRGEAEQEAQGEDVVERDAPDQVAAQHGAETPEDGGGERLEHSPETVCTRVERVGLVDEPEPREAAGEEPAEARPRAFAEDQRRSHHRHERLRLLHHDRRDEVVLQRLREENRGRSRGAGPDHDCRDDVTCAGAPHRTERRQQQGQREQHEEDVLAEDDGACRDAQDGLAEERVGAPHRGGDRDEDDPGNGCRLHTHPELRLARRQHPEYAPRVILYWLFKRIRRWWAARQSTSAG